MTSLLLKPLTGLIYAAFGALLASLWFRGLGHWALAIVVLVALTGWVVQFAGNKKLPNDPVQAVRLFEARPVLIGAVTAGAAAIVFILGIELAVEGAGESDTGQVKQTKEAFKGIAQTLTAALGAYITALTVKAEDVDAAVGEYVEKRFQEVYLIDKEATIGSPPRKEGGVVHFAPDSLGATALYTKLEFGLYDWSKPNRKKRAEKIAEHLAPKPRL